MLLSAKFLKSRSNKDREAYKKQRNLCVSLLRQNKRLLSNFRLDNNKLIINRAPLFYNKSKAKL